MDCVQGSGIKSKRWLLSDRKTNVIISTVGMTPVSHNHKGIMQLVIPCESFDVVFQDEKQNENGQHLMLIPCFLKPSGIAVLFDDKTQTPPHQPRIFRPSRVQDPSVTPVETHDLRDLHMSIASSPFRPSMKKNAPIQEWLSALMALMEERQHFVVDGSLSDYSGYECDERMCFLLHRII